MSNEYRVGRRKSRVIYPEYLISVKQCVGNTEKLVIWDKSLSRDM